MHIDDMLDVVLYVLAAAVGLTICITCTVLIQHTQASERVERALVEVRDDNTPDAVVYSNDEAMLTIVIQDTFMQAPNKIQIGSNPVITFDATWFGSRETKINQVWNNYMKTCPAITDNGLYLEDSGAGELIWKVHVS